MADHTHPDPLGDIAAFAVLGDERRRRLYDYVAAQRRPVGRDEAAAAVGIGRPLAAYHLEKLARAGLLDVAFARPPGRGGPGAGRPAKHYLRAEHSLVAQAPARDYAFAAELLADAVDDAGPDVAGAARTLARERGRELGASLRPHTDLGVALAARGYEPHRAADGTVTLANCPFHAVAATHPELVCSLNHAYIEGLLAETGDSHTAHLEPDPGRCCIVIRPAA